MNRQVESALATSVWRSISSHLHNEQHRLDKEIKNYPRPIAVCDLQFNYLLEQRAGISQELNRKQKTAEGSRRRKDSMKLLDDVISSSRYIDKETKQRIVSSLKEDAKGGHDENKN